MGSVVQCLKRLVEIGFALFHDGGTVAEHSTVRSRRPSPGRPPRKAQPPCLVALVS
jgi:hypothetical protein